MKAGLLTWNSFLRNNLKLQIPPKRSVPFSSEEEPRVRVQDAHQEYEQWRSQKQERWIAEVDHGAKLTVSIDLRCINSLLIKFLEN